MKDRLNWYKCPDKNLTDMVGFLNQKRFATFLIEPGFDNARRLVEGGSDYEVVEVYHKLLRAYDKVQRIAFRLFQFGDSLEEIKDNLILHVCECRECDREYSEMVDRRLEEEFSKLERRFPGFTKSLKLHQVEYMRERIDRRYLDLTSFLD